MRWATTPHPHGRGVVDTADALVRLPADVLLVAAVRFLEWLATPVDGDLVCHPLVGGGSGRRRTARPLRRWTIRSPARLSWVDSMVATVQRFSLDARASAPARTLLDDAGQRRPESVVIRTRANLMCESGHGVGSGSSRTNDPHAEGGCRT